MNDNSRNTKPTLLVVDDTEDIRDLVTSVLQDTYTIRPAFDGRSALRRALEKPTPDLVLPDVDMPGASGYDVCRRLRAATQTRPTVIAVTGWGTPEDRQRALDAGERKDQDHRHAGHQRGFGHGGDRQVVRVHEQQADAGKQE